MGIDLTEIPFVAHVTERKRDAQGRILLESADFLAYLRARALHDMPLQRYGVTVHGVPTTAWTVDAATAHTFDAQIADGLPLYPYQTEGIRCLVVTQAVASQQQQPTAIEARSGLLHWGCGAGKTRAMVVALLTLRAKALVVLPNEKTATQFLLTLEQCATAQTFARLRIVTTVGCKRLMPTKQWTMRHLLDSDVFVLTYEHMVLHRNDHQLAGAAPLFCVPFHVLMLDEAHNIAATETSKCVQDLLYHVAWAFTATVGRVDERIVEDVAATPVLHRVDNAFLSTSGYVATVQRVLCLFPPCPELTATLGSALHPWKLRALLSMVAGAGDCLVFCYRNDALRLVYSLLRAHVTHKPVLGPIDQHVSYDDRHRVYDAFGRTGGVLVLSQVGEEALNLVPRPNHPIEYFRVHTIDTSAQRETQGLGRVGRVNGLRHATRAYIFVTAGSQEEAFARERIRKTPDMGEAEEWDWTKLPAPPLADVEAVCRDWAASDDAPLSTAAKDADDDKEEEEDAATSSGHAAPVRSPSTSRSRSLSPVQLGDDDK